MRCEEHQDEWKFATRVCPICAQDRLAWVRRNIKRIKDFAFTGDVYRQQIDGVVDYIIERINEDIGDDPDAEDPTETIQ